MKLWPHADETGEDPGATVIRLPGAELVPAGTPPVLDVELEPDTSPLIPARLRAAVERDAGKSMLPSRARALSTAGWYLDNSPRLLTRACRACLREVIPVARGAGWLVAGWWRFATDAEWRTKMRGAAEREGYRHYEQGRERHLSRVRFRVVGSLIIGLPGAGGAWVAVELWPGWAAVVGFGVVGVLDLIGRATRKQDPDAPEAEPEWVLLAPGVPLAKLRASIVGVLTAEGLEDLTADSLVWLERRKQYRLRITTQHEIKDSDLRAVERAVGAPKGAISLLETNISAVRELVIPDGDPHDIRSIPTCPWVPTGSISINDLITLGVSVGELAFALRLAAHIQIVGGTGGGKTKWALWVLIDLLSACRDVVLWQVGVRKEPDMTLWGGVLQRRASTSEEAKVVLEAVVEELERRQAELDALAEDDDPTNDRNEYTTDMGPVLFVVLDEFSLLVQHPELLALVEYVIREGRKVLILLILATQKTGNTDFGSTLMQGQPNIKIALPCTQADADKMFTPDKRKAGWAPHLLTAGVTGNPHDAGKCYVESGELTEPDVYRFYRPLSNGEIKRRRAQRLADGLPTLGESKGDSIDVQTIPDYFAAITAAFSAHRGIEYLSAQEIGTYAAGVGLPWNDKVRSELREAGVRTRDKFGQGKKYFRMDVEAAVKAAENDQGGSR